MAKLRSASHFVRAAVSKAGDRVLTGRLADRVLLRPINRIAPRAETIVIAPPGAGDADHQGGNVGDRAMVEAVVANVGGPIRIIIAGRDRSGPLASFPPRVTVERMPALIYGSGLANFAAFLRLRTRLRSARHLAVVGADIMDGAYNLRASTNRARVARIAAGLGVDARVLGFSWNAAPNPAAASALRAAGQAGATLLLRDPVSLRRACGDGLPTTVPTADLVFLASENSAAAVQRYLGAQPGPFGIVNVSGFVGRSVDQVAEYDAVIASLLRRGLRVVLLPHSARPGADDLSACRAVFERHPGRELTFVAELLRPADIMGFCAAASIVVTGRMHLAIMALNNAVPAVVLTTQGKVEGLLELFDMSDKCIDPVASFGRQLAVAVERTLEQSTAQIRNALPAVRELARRNLIGLPPVETGHRIEEVVSGGMCVGCGACSFATGGAIPISIGRRQSLTASLEGVAESDIRLGSKVCPFSDESRNEDEIAAVAMPPGLDHDDRLGVYTQIVAGRLTDDSRLVGSSSGGLTSWVAMKLLERGDVDGIIHVQPGDPLFSYQVSYSVQAVAANRKSMYYSTSFAQALQAIRGDGRTYAFIGVPCFVRAARLLCENDGVLAGQLRFFLGLVCGHLKSFGFAESLAWQLGVKPADLGSVDFRVKVPDRASSNYDFGARARGAHELISRPTGTLVGGSWGHGAFQLNACNYCDDIFAETADVSFGDAWLARYKKDWHGTNVVVSRHSVIDGILAEGARTGELTLAAISTDEAAATQAGNFRHRRDGLSVRLADDVAQGLSVPTKRIAPGQLPVTRSRRRLIRLRREMTAQSQTLFTQAKDLDSLPHYLDGMTPLIARYRRAERRAMPLVRRATPVVRRVARKARRVANP